MTADGWSPGSQGQGSTGPGHTTLVIPQGQGSAAGHPRQLVSGAHHLATLLPTARQRVVDPPAAAGGEPDEADGVRHLAALTAFADATRAALRESGDDVVLAVGGDCGIELAPVAHAVARHGGDLAVIWFDAHPDLNTPETSPSGGFHGMVLRTLLGEGPRALLPRPEATLLARQVVLAGVRALDPAEQRCIEAEGIPSVPVQALAAPQELVATVAATGASHVYIHIDLDVLDPRHFAGQSCPEPDGLHPGRLRETLRALTGRFTLAGAGITEHAPAGADSDDRALRAIVEGLGFGPGSGLGSG